MQTLRHSSLTAKQTTKRSSVTRVMVCSLGSQYGRNLSFWTPGERILQI